MYPELLAHIKRFVHLEPHEEELLCNRLQLKTLKRRELLLEAGKICPGNYFVVKGCVRQYFLNNKLNEQIIQFGLENWWIADQDSMMTHKPATTYIQAIEPTELLLFPTKDQEDLFSQIPRLESYFRIMMQKAFVAAQRRIGFIFNMSDEERYHHFAKLFPEFMQRVPQYMLASYLGFTPQFMSRLRAKKS